MQQLQQPRDHSTGPAHRWDYVTTCEGVVAQRQLDLDEVFASMISSHVGMVDT